MTDHVCTYSAKTARCFTCSAPRPVEHSCYGAIFLGSPRAVAQVECPACALVP